MVFAVIGLLAIALFLTVSEWIICRYKKTGELSRKWVHIIVASFVALWPFFTAREYVVLLSIGFIIGIAVSRKYRFFRSIHSVQRATIGDLLFPAAILVCALFAESPAVFAAAILHMSLADGLAAVSGTLWGKSNHYHVFGQQKSLVGSLAFLTVSIGIIQTFLVFGGGQSGSGGLIITAIIPLAAVFLENTSPYGFDNLTVPLFVLVTLNML